MGTITDIIMDIMAITMAIQQSTPPHTKRESLVCDVKDMVMFTILPCLTINQSTRNVSFVKSATHVMEGNSLRGSKQSLRTPLDTLSVRHRMYQDLVLRATGMDSPTIQACHTTEVRIRSVSSVRHAKRAMEKV